MSRIIMYSIAVTFIKSVSKSNQDTSTFTDVELLIRFDLREVFNDLTAQNSVLFKILVIIIDHF